MRDRIGQLFPVYSRYVDIFQDIPQGTGLSLGHLHSVHDPQNASIAKVRTKIGTGITLSNEGATVWLYNRSMADIFVSSFSLNDAERSQQWRVYKVRPGFAIPVYDQAVIDRKSLQQTAGDGPADPHSIHVSFVKGWGRGYTRQSIMSCACWLELILHTDR